MLIRQRVANDDPEWLRMRSALWPDGTVEEHRKDMVEWLARADAAVLVAVRQAGAGLAGFAEVGTRLYAEGCESSPVAFLEGWYVDPDLRRQGVGRSLILAAEEWARDHGLTEIASDALLGNSVAHHAHEAAGFVEVERSVRYRKRL